VLPSQAAKPGSNRWESDCLRRGSILRVMLAMALMRSESISHQAAAAAAEVVPASQALS
jgi:hypothetical protein